MKGTTASRFVWLLTAVATGLLVLDFSLLLAAYDVVADSWRLPLMGAGAGLAVLQLGLVGIEIRRLSHQLELSQEQAHTFFGRDPLSRLPNRLLFTERLNIEINRLGRTDGGVAILVGADQDIVVRQVKRERVEGDCHLRVQGKRNEQIDGKQSLTVGKDRHEKIAKSHALEAGQQIHLKAGTALVIEAAKDLTLKGPGGFIRIDAQGVTIQGDLVKINSGGSAGSGAGSQPEAPEEAKEAVVVEPVKPEPENVALTGIAQ